MVKPSKREIRTLSKSFKDEYGYEEKDIIEWRMDPIARDVWAMMMKNGCILIANAETGETIDEADAEFEGIKSLEELGVKKHFTLSDCLGL